MKKGDTSDLILPVAFIGGGLLSGWIGGHWQGLAEVLCAVLGGFVIGRWRRG